MTALQFQIFDAYRYSKFNLMYMSMNFLVAYISSLVNYSRVFLGFFFFGIQGLSIFFLFLSKSRLSKISARWFPVVRHFDRQGHKNPVTIIDVKLKGSLRSFDRLHGKKKKCAKRFVPLPPLKKGGSFFCSQSAKPLASGEIKEEEPYLTN